jgi:hypothetical protein
MKTPFDLILFGATGFTGQPGGRIPEHHAPWAASPCLGRWPVAASTSWCRCAICIGADPALPLLVADASHRCGVAGRRWCAQARVVITTVGPYQLHGTALVDRLREGRHRLRRPVRRARCWMAQMIGAAWKARRGQERRAHRLLVRLRFDPLRPRRAVPAARGAAAFRQAAAAGCAAGYALMKGSFSGGTLASAMARLRWN